jgi:hypothetical protein
MDEGRIAAAETEAALINPLLIPPSGLRYGGARVRRGREDAMSRISMILSAGVVAAALAGLCGPGFAQTTASPGPPQSVSVPPAPGTSEAVIIAPETKRATPPDGDPRSIGEKRADQTAFDRCLLNAPEADMTHPIDTSPDEYCSHRLGMWDRNAIPDSVRMPKNSH